MIVYLNYRRPGDDSTIIPVTSEVRVGFPYIFPIFSHIKKKNIFLCLIFSHHGKCPIYFPYMSYVPFYISHIFPIYFPYISLQIGSFFCWPHDLRHPDAVLGAMLKLAFIPTARSCGVYSIVLGVQIGKIKFERINL
jgi:hypothetical protein